MVKQGEQRDMDDTEVWNVACRAAEQTVGNRVITLGTRVTSLENDLMCLLVHFVRISCGQLILFMQGVQPKRLLHKLHFADGKFSWVLERLSNETRESLESLRNVIDRLTIGRNQSAHCLTTQELAVRVKDSLEMFHRHVSLIHVLKDKHYVLSHSTAFHYVPESLLQLAVAVIQGSSDGNKKWPRSRFKKPKNGRTPRTNVVTKYPRKRGKRAKWG